MWKISRNLIFPRWHANKRTTVENTRRNVPSKVLVSLLQPENNSSSDKGYKQKERHEKQSKRFWNCDQFQYLLSRCYIFETAGWLGTVTVLCFRFHTHHINSIYENKRKKFNCIFSRNVLAMPEKSSKEDPLQPDVHSSGTNIKVSTNGETKSKNVVADPSFPDTLQVKSSQYVATLQNSSGVSALNGNDRRSFRHFQNAARLGSSQGFYNLGLCYELGKGTRVNLSRAAFCYRKAAMKGHGLASFNLAVYFFKGIGGLPVDHETAKLLLAEAADKNIPEAQIYLGLECLETEKWSDAYEIFSSLSARNIVDGKYYLGLCYENGWGVNKNEKAAMELFSQTATSGHAKSILKLAKCYEEGFAGYDPDLNFSEALCQILADQGDVEGQKALLRLRVRKQNLSLRGLFEIQLPFLNGKSTLPTSTSFPEMKSKQTTSFKPHPITPSYLDLITPFMSLKTDSSRPSEKPTFYIGDDKLNSSLSNNFMPFCQQNNVTVLAANT